MAAGQSTGSDGYPNILIKHPITGKSILEHALEAFKGKKITVVVGYKALQIIEQFPKINFVLNSRWALTRNSMSLGLALSEEPTYVMSGDIFVGAKLVERLDSLAGNLALTAYTENRSLSSIHCVLGSGGVIASTYQGPIQSPDHPEAVGLYKVSSPEVLSMWKSRCLKYTNLHAGQLLPCSSDNIVSENLNQNDEFHEVNNAEDYLKLVKKLVQND